MRKNVAILVALAVLASASIWAEDSGTELGDGTSVFERYPSALGAYANVPVMGGLTYQRWFGRMGVEATLGGIISESGDYDYNVQGAFQYMVYGEDFADWVSGALYTNVLLGHRGEGMLGTTYAPTGYLGLGIGIEMVFLRHLSTSIEFMYVGAVPWELVFGFGGSLKYRF